MSRGQVFITFEYEADLSLEECFPDGVPENPTAADVQKLIEKDGGPSQVINDWNFDDPTVNISVQVSS